MRAPCNRLASGAPRSGPSPFTGVPRSRAGRAAPGRWLCPRWRLRRTIAGSGDTEVAAVPIEHDDAAWGERKFALLSRSRRQPFSSAKEPDKGADPLRPLLDDFLRQLPQHDYRVFPEQQRLPPRQGLRCRRLSNETDPETDPSSPPSKVALTSIGSRTGAAVSFIAWAREDAIRDRSIDVASR